MNPDQLRTVQEMAKTAATIHADELVHDLDRTLLVGTMSNGNGIHVYLKDGRIHRLTHAQKNYGYAESKVWAVGDLAYGHSFRPEWADFDFVCRMVERGAYFHWLPYVDSLYRQSWHGDFQGPIKENFQ